MTRRSLFYPPVRATLRALSRLPFGVLYALSDLLFPLVYHVVRYRRAVVRRNLRSSFPEATAAWLRQTERRFYHSFCDYLVETLKLLTISPEHMRERMQMDGMEALEEALRDHTLAFVYLGHYGNWEYVSTLPLWVPAGVHCAQLYSPLHSRMADRLFFELRTRFGSENIAKNEALRRLVTLQREGRKTVVGFISDQAPKWVNIHDWVPFLHHDTPVFTGTERIAKKLDAAVVYCDVQRVGRGRYKAHFSLMTNHPADFPDYRLTECYMQRLEKTILANPPYWLWSHDRWKRKHADWAAHQKAGAAHAPKP